MPHSRIIASSAGLFAVALIVLFLFGSGSLVSKQQSTRASDSASDFVAVATTSGTLWVARDEATVSQWLDCVEDGSCDAIKLDSSKQDHPITGINLQDVSDFLQWYRRTHKTPVRLPTQEEWLQFAANDAPIAKKKLFDDPRMAWAADYDLTAVPQSKQTEPSGSFGNNNYNINDLKGNVWEWTDTCQSDIDPSLKERLGCITGRYAMGQHASVLSDKLRQPGNAGCGTGQPPANVGLRLVWQAD